MDTTDTAIIQIWVGLAQYDVRGDLDLDGDVDATDNSTATAMIGTTLGRGVLSRDDVQNRCGYAGYRFDEAVLKYHVRNRVYDPWLGRWMNRDPIRYAGNAMNLYEYAYAGPQVGVDPSGLQGIFRDASTEIVSLIGNLISRRSRDNVAVQNAVTLAGHEAGAVIDGCTTCLDEGAEMVLDTLTSGWNGWAPISIIRRSLDLPPLDINVPNIPKVFPEDQDRWWMAGSRWAAKAFWCCAPPYGSGAAARAAGFRGLLKFHPADHYWHWFGKKRYMAHCEIILYKKGAKVVPPLKVRIPVPGLPGWPRIIRIPIKLF